LVALQVHFPVPPCDTTACPKDSDSFCVLDLAGKALSVRRIIQRYALAH